CCSVLPRPPTSPLLPYTTLFRSVRTRASGESQRPAPPARLRVVVRGGDGPRRARRRPARAAGRAGPTPPLALGLVGARRRRLSRDDGARVVHRGLRPPVRPRVRGPHGARRGRGVLPAGAHHARSARPAVRGPRLGGDGRTRALVLRGVPVARAGAAFRVPDRLCPPVLGAD